MFSRGFVLGIFLQAENFLARQRHYWKNMDCTALEPPSEVRGMQVLQREAFRKSVQIPRLHIKEEQANKVLPLVKKLLLKMEHLRPVRVMSNETESSSNTAKTDREILLHPLPVKSWDSLPTNELEQLKVDASHFGFKDLELTYENWRADEIFKAVLPKDEEGLTSYSRIGHIVHLNLRDHLLPYKSLIGDVLRDKVSGCRTVVTKAANIDNTYRNFEFELICGDDDYQVETKENGISFSFDFSRVYWNPRLSTEHERIVQMLKTNDVLYDIFAGVGPFSVPAAKKRCWVLANDLNPESYRWLQHNAKRNKCLSHIQMCNKDGRDFILNEVKSDLLKRWKEKTEGPYNVHITMNLPAMAVEFLDAFRGLFSNEADNLSFPSSNFNYPLVHVYAFVKGEDTKTLVRSLVEQHLGLPLKDEENLQGINFVRNVAPNKDMYRISFYLTKEILTSPIEKRNKKNLTVVEEVQGHKRLSTDKLLPEEDLPTAKLKCV